VADGLFMRGSTAQSVVGTLIYLPNAFRTNYQRCAVLIAVVGFGEVIGETVTSRTLQQ
jgi:hypothetical protein